jgi:hypothetical protein
MEEQKKVPRKQCSKCKDYKLLTEFFNEKRKPDGKQSRCKLCHTAGVREWKSDHKTDLENIDALVQHDQMTMEGGVQR